MIKPDSYEGSAHHVLLVDDDEAILDLLKTLLVDAGFKVTAVISGDAMLALFQEIETPPFDIVVLDVMMPGRNGIAACQALREKYHVPVILLTAVDDDAKRILGFEVGADDYLTKPFNPLVLLARIKSLLRRHTTVGMDATEKIGSFAQRSGKPLCFAQWILDPVQRLLFSPDGVEVDLTQGEYRLLEVLVNHPQQILSRDELLELTENRQAGPYDRSIDVRISRLRQKLEVDPKVPRLIQTVRSGGYVLACTVETKGKS
ncbi:MAG: response regulator [Gammaproteobacteria bacterium]